MLKDQIEALDKEFATHAADMEATLTAKNLWENHSGVRDYSQPQSASNQDGNSSSKPQVPALTKIVELRTKLDAINNSVDPSKAFPQFRSAVEAQIAATSELYDATKAADNDLVAALQNAKNTEDANDLEQIRIGLMELTENINLSLRDLRTMQIYITLNTVALTTRQNEINGVKPSNGPWDYVDIQQQNKALEGYSEFWKEFHECTQADLHPTKTALRVGRKIVRSEIFIPLKGI